MKSYDVNPHTIRIPLGKQGENEARQIAIDVTEFYDLGTDGDFVLLHQRASDTAPYPVAITTDRNTVIWPVTSADTAIPGYGKCELQYIIDGAIAKSVTWKTRTEVALEEAGEAPDPETGWVAQMMQDIYFLVTTGLASIEFSFNAATGQLSYTTLDNFEGLEFSINDDGYLEVEAG